MSLFKFTALLYVVVTLSGCLGNTPIVPVYNKSFTSPAMSKYHFVARGETLYSIAWRYGINVEELAVANSVDAAYRIYPGQKLRIKDLARVKNASQAQPLKVPKTTPKIQAVAPPKKVAAVVLVPKIMPVEGEEYWHWPIKGKLKNGGVAVTTSFKGIDIKTQLGDSVLAARSGKVVYAGDSLRGYGNLIIVMHDESYLSAYGYNRNILVGEGDRVKRGQKIAEAGASAGGGVRLHFEIRHNGKSVDPLSILPKR